MECDEGVYFDTFSGIGALPFGHGWEPAIRAAQLKLEHYSHVSNFFADEDALLLEQSLLAADGRQGEAVFANSGAEANEAALKAVLATPGEGRILALQEGFHGRTLGALSLTTSGRAGFEPSLLPIERIEPTADALRRAASRGPIKALWFEALQGSAGVIPLTDELAEEFKKHQAHGTLLVADEVQCGLGRAGSFYAYRQWNLKPDLVTLAKGLGGGLPLGACLCFGRAKLKAGQHGSTFAPNPVSCAAGRAVIQALTPELMDRVHHKGARLADGLKRLPWCGGVRGRGLMLAALTDNAQAVKREAFNRRILLNITNGVVRFLPALNITDSQIDELLDRLNFIPDALKATEMV